MKNLRPQDIKIGDSVRVKHGTGHSYIHGYLIEGFEGRVFDKYKNEENWIIEIEFDSITIRSMSAKYIRDNINDGTDYACHDLGLNDIIKSKARDTIEDVVAARQKIYKKTGFLSILDEKGYNVWKKQPAKKEKEPKPKRGELTSKVAMARARTFFTMLEEVQAKKKKAMQEAKKIDPNKKIKLEDLLNCMYLHEEIKEVLLGDKAKQKPFLYVEDITKEKFLALPGLDEICWYHFMFAITQGLHMSKYHYVIPRLVKLFNIDIMEVLSALLPPGTNVTLSGTSIVKFELPKDMNKKNMN